MSFLKEASQIREGGGRLISLSGARAEDEVRLTYHFELEGQLCSLELTTKAHSAPSLFSTFPNADLPERQAAQFFQVKFVGHPNLSR